MKLIHNHYASILGFIVFFVVALSKISLGPDELTHLEIGTIFLNEGIYTNTKIHPLLSIFSASINQLINNPLMTYKIIYGFTGALLSLSIFKILKEFMLYQYDIKKVHFFVILTPGILLFSLYSISNIFYTAIAYYSIYITYLALKKDSYMHLIFAGILLGSSYLARFEGLILFISLISILIFIKLFIDRSLKIYSQIVVLFSSFLVCVLPWHIYLLSNDLIFSNIIYGGYDSGIWKDGISKFLIGDNKISFDEFNLIAHFLMPIGKNIVLYSEAISNVRTFPFFFLPFIIFGLYELKYSNKLYIFIAPLLATLSYMFFYVEARYVTAAIPVLSILAGLGIVNLLKNHITKINFYHIITLVMFMDVIFGVLWIFAEH